MWTVSVWDDRDTEATDPESSLGDFFTEQQANAALDSYLRMHGAHVYHFRRFRVWCHGDEVVTKTQQPEILRLSPSTGKARRRSRDEALPSDGTDCAE